MAGLQHLADLRAALEWLDSRGARALVTDSRRVQPGDAFIAWPGHALDGRQYVKAALAAGPGGTAPLAQTQGHSVGGKRGTSHKQGGKDYAARR